MRVKHWQDPVNGLLGIWLIISPWLLGFTAATTGTAVAMSTTIVAGIILLVVSIIAMSTSHAWNEWVDIILGILLIISPWVLGFANQVVARQNAWICGVIMIILALWVMGVDDQFGFSHNRAAM